MEITAGGVLRAASAARLEVGILGDGAAQRRVEFERVYVEGLGPGRVGDDRGDGESLYQRPGDARVDRRDQPDPQRGQPGGNQRDGEPWTAAEIEHRRHAVEHI